MGNKKVILFELCPLDIHSEERVMKFVEKFDNSNDLWEFIGYSYSEEEQKNLFYIEAFSGEAEGYLKNGNRRMLAKNT